MQRKRTDLDHADLLSMFTYDALSCKLQLHVGGKKKVEIGFQGKWGGDVKKAACVVKFHAITLDGQACMF